MAIQILRALSAATTIVAVDTAPDKLETATRMGADEALISATTPSTRIFDITRGHGAELVLDMVGVNPTLKWPPEFRACSATSPSSASVAAPYRSTSIAQRNECAVASPFWGSIPELLEVVKLAQTGKIRMLVEHFPLERAGEAYQLLHDGKINGRAVITPND